MVTQPAMMNRTSGNLLACWHSSVLDAVHPACKTDKAGKRVFEIFRDCRCAFQALSQTMYTSVQQQDDILAMRS